MSNLPLLGETALLLAVAYLAGCFLGVALRRLSLSAFRGRVGWVRTADRRPGRTLIAGVDAAFPLALPPPMLKVGPSVPPPQEGAVASSGGTAPVEPPMALMDAALSRPARPVATIIPLPRREPIPDTAEIAAIGRPPALAAARDGAADDLKQIKGIGPRLESSLNALGIFHFDQIARWNEMNLAWIDAQPHLRGRAIRDEWVDQAATLSGLDLRPPAVVPSQGLAEPLKVAN